MYMSDLHHLSMLCSAIAMGRMVLPKCWRGGTWYLQDLFEVSFSVWHCLTKYICKKWKMVIHIIHVGPKLYLLKFLGKANLEFEKIYSERV
jgi:hypothetical protein